MASQPYLIMGDTSWWSPIFTESIKENYPFLRDSVIEPLPSRHPEVAELLIFQAQGHGVLGLYDGETLFYLGKDPADAEKRFEVVREHGWNFSNFTALTDTGDLDPHWHPLGFYGDVLTKTLTTDPESRPAELTSFREEVIQFIHEKPAGHHHAEWKERALQGVDQYFAKLLEVAREVAFVDVRVYGLGYVYLRWTDDTGGVGKVLV